MSFLLTNSCIQYTYNPKLNIHMQVLMQNTSQLIFGIRPEPSLHVFLTHSQLRLNPHQFTHFIFIIYMVTFWDSLPSSVSDLTISGGSLPSSAPLLHAFLTSINIYISHNLYKSCGHFWDSLSSSVLVLIISGGSLSSSAPLSHVFLIFSHN